MLRGNCDSDCCRISKGGNYVLDVTNITGHGETLWRPLLTLMNALEEENNGNAHSDVHTLMKDMIRESNKVKDFRAGIPIATLPNATCSSSYNLLDIFIFFQDLRQL